jgi:hypothetical protein
MGAMAMDEKLDKVEQYALAILLKSLGPPMEATMEEIAEFAWRTAITFDGMRPGSRHQHNKEQR